MVLGGVSVCLFCSTQEKCWQSISDASSPATNWNGQQCKRKCVCVAHLRCHINAGTHPHPPLMATSQGSPADTRDANSTSACHMEQKCAWKGWLIFGYAGQPCQPQLQSHHHLAQHHCWLTGAELVVKLQTEILHDGWMFRAQVLHHSTLTQACASAGGAMHPYRISHASTSAQETIRDPHAEAHCADPSHWWGHRERAYDQQKQDGCSMFVCGHEIVSAKWEQQLLL